jgi:lysozyme
VARKQRLVPMIATVACLAVCAIAAVMLLRRSSKEPAPEVPGCSDGPTTPGIDVSYYQETIDWPRVHRAGMRFAFIRISDGTTISDQMFVRNWAGAKRAKLLRGGYQHFRPDESAAAQADLVIAALAREPGELPPAIDVEVTGGKTPAQIAAGVRTWIDRVRSRLHVEPIVYTSPDFWRDRVGDANLSAQPLWVAHYTTDCPRVPAAWTHWTFWQHSEAGQVPGIDGPVDLDALSGSLDALRTAEN